MSIKTFIIISKIYIYVTPTVQKFLILHKNVPIRTLNLLFSEKHLCRFAPLVLSFHEWHLWWAAPLRYPLGGEILNSPMSGLRLSLFTNLKQVNSNFYHYWRLVES